MKKLILFLFVLCMVPLVSADLNISIIHPVNGTEYSDTSVDLNFTINSSYINCQYDYNNLGNISLMSNFSFNSYGRNNDFSESIRDGSISVLYNDLNNDLLLTSLKSSTSITQLNIYNVTDSSLVKLAEKNYSNPKNQYFHTHFTSNETGIPTKYYQVDSNYDLIFELDNELINIKNISYPPGLTNCTGIDWYKNNFYFYGCSGENVGKIFVVDNSFTTQLNSFEVIGRSGYSGGGAISLSFYKNHIITTDFVEGFSDVHYLVYNLSGALIQNNTMNTTDLNQIYNNELSDEFAGDIAISNNFYYVDYLEDGYIYQAYNNISYFAQNITLTDLSINSYNVSVSCEDYLGLYYSSPYTYFSIGNTAPTTTNPTLNASTVYTNDYIKCLNGSFSDVNEDSKANDYYRWYNDGVLIPNQNNHTLDLSVNGSKEDNINCEWLADDGSDNSSSGWLASENVTISNTLPISNETFITPSPASFENDLTGNGVYYDPDDDAYVNETRWYNDSVQITELNDKTIVGFGNISTNDKWIFSIRFYDGVGYSPWYNSSELTIGDITAPTFLSNSTNPSSVERDSTIQIYLNVTDGGSSINSILAEVENPNNIKVNYTMVLYEGTNSASQETKWNYNFTTSIVGTHNVVFYAEDSSTNLDSASGLSFSVTTPTTPSSGGGGGGGDSDECSTTQDCIDDFGQEYYCQARKCLLNTSRISNGACNYNGVCEFERGETIFTCKCDPFYGCGNFDKGSGDCEAKSASDIWTTIKQQRFIWIATFIAIGGTVWLWLSTRKTFKIKTR